MPLPRYQAQRASLKTFLLGAVPTLTKFVDENELVTWKVRTGDNPVQSDPADAAWVPPYNDETAYATQLDQIRSWWKRPKDIAFPTKAGDIVTVDADVVVMEPTMQIGDILVREDDSVYRVEKVTPTEVATHVTAHVRRLQ